MTSLLYSSLGFLLGWLVCREICLRQAGRVLQESEARFAEQLSAAQQREQRLIDQLLVKHGRQPLATIEREQVVKLPDPETPQRSWVDQAIRDDEIKEMVEMSVPDAVWMTAAEARETYAANWRAAEMQWEQEHAPLRV